MYNNVEMRVAKETSKGVIICSVIAAVSSIIVAVLSGFFAYNTKGDNITFLEKIEDLTGQKIENEAQIKEQEIIIEQLKIIIDELQNKLDQMDNEPTSSMEDILRSPDNDSSNLLVTDEDKTVSANHPVDWLDSSFLYQTSDVDVEVSPSKTFAISGKKYVSGIIIHTGTAGSSRYILYNMSSYEFSTFAFDFGHIDNTGEVDVVLNIYKDDQLSESWEVNSESLIKPYEVKVDGAQQLKIEIKGGLNGTYASYGIVNGAFI